MMDFRRVVILRARLAFGQAYTPDRRAREHYTRNARVIEMCIRLAAKPTLSQVTARRNHHRSEKQLAVHVTERIYPRICT